LGRAWIVSLWCRNVRLRSRIDSNPCSLLSLAAFATRSRIAASVSFAAISSNRFRTKWTTTSEELRRRERRMNPGQQILSGASWCVSMCVVT